MSEENHHAELANTLKDIMNKEEEKKPNVPEEQTHSSRFCRKCGRILSSPKSIKLGIGPICAKKSGIDEYELERQIDEQNKKKSKGELEDNNYPPLSFYQSKVMYRECSCGGTLLPLDHFMHDGGYSVQGYKHRQWIYSECDKCHNAYALWKLIK